MRFILLVIAFSFLSGCGAGGSPASYGYGKNYVFDDPHLRELKYKWEEENGRRSW